MLIEDIEELHALVDHIPVGDLPAARKILRALADPVWQSILAAPLDDEPESEAERADVEKATWSGRHPSHPAESLTCRATIAGESKPMPVTQAANEKMSTRVSLAASAACPPLPQNYKTKPIPESDTWLRFLKSDLNPSWHPGHPLPSAILCQGRGSAISNSTIGLPFPAYASRVPSPLRRQTTRQSTGSQHMRARLLHNC